MLTTIPAKTIMSNTFEFFVTVSPNLISPQATKFDNTGWNVCQETVVF